MKTSLHEEQGVYGHAQKRFGCMLLSRNTITLFIRENKFVRSEIYSSDQITS